ncbi:penta-EF hand family protein [Marimonas lutisalis]|uniref:EF-hand domain-containing protein n=1 Tax=Marimonas lutisalis TaxID=2545756 RepID=UPI0010F7A6FC|nr:EF-hand domain-containing protein [Marimonas lutisalis]
MKAHILVLGAAVLAATQAFAAPVDSDGNGTFSMEEMSEAYPNLTEEQFADMDANEDGEIDEVELNDAIENGVIEG